MNLFKSKLRGSISLMLALALIFSFVGPITSFSVDAAKEDVYSVKVRVEGLNSTFIKAMNVSVDNLDLSKYPGIEKPASHYDGLRPIHAIVKALEKSGIDPKDKNKFDIGFDGNYIKMINDLAAEGNSGWMYRVDNKNADAGAGDYKIKSGQEIVVYFVEDFMENTYSWFDKESINIGQGEEFELKLNGHSGFDETVEVSEVEGATILVNGKEYKKDNQVIKTDSKGKVSLSFEDMGSYHISAKKENAKGINIISRPYAIVKVDKSNIDKENTIKSIEQVKNIELALKTSKEKAMSLLPKTTNIIDKLGKKHIVNLKWTMDNYSGEKAGEYTARATFKLPSGVVQTKPETKLELTTKVFVGKKDTSKPTKLDGAIKKTVDYYKKNNPTNPEEEWETFVGLWAVDAAIDKDYSWESIDPGFGTKISTNETITYAYSLLSQGKDPSNIWAGRNLFKELSSQQGEKGVFSNIGKHVFSMILLDNGQKMGADVGKWNEANRQRAIDGLLEMQNKDGSFGSFSYLDHTAWSLIALSEYRDQGQVDIAIEKALKFLKAKQIDNGAFDYNGEFEKGENSNSIAVIIQGLIAVGEDVSNPNGNWSKNGNTALDALLKYQEDDGSFLWKTASKVKGPSTKQALVALADLKNGKSSWHRLGEEIYQSSISEKDIGDLISDINKLPKADKITFDDKAVIMKAYNKYLQFPKEYRAKVTNRALLLKAKETVDKIEKEIDFINDGIWELPGKTSDISLKQKDKVLDLVKRYNLLSESDKKHIEYYDELEAAKAQIDKLMAKEKDKDNDASSENSPKTGDEGIITSIILFAISLITIIFINKKKRIN